MAGSKPKKKDRRNPWQWFKNALGRMRAERVERQEHRQAQKMSAQKARERIAENKRTMIEAALQRAETEKQTKAALQKMAEKAAGIDWFVKACQERGLDPKATFLRWHPVLENDPKVVRMEFEARMDRQKEGVRLSPTKFYANMIVERLRDQERRKTGDGQKQQ